MILTPMNMIMNTKKIVMKAEVKRKEKQRKQKRFRIERKKGRSKNLILINMKNP